MVSASLALLWVGTASGFGPADKCVAAKIRESGKYVQCRMKAEAKAVKKGTSPDFTRCDQKLEGKWAKIESKGAGACPTTGDLAAVRDIAAADTGLLAGTVAAKGRFEDNGNGTITDWHTGLTWEKKSLYDGSIHDVTKRYTWADAFSVHVTTLNATAFGGHEDWRVPTLKELLSLLDFTSAENVPGYAAFDVNCDQPGGPVVPCDVLTCSCAFSEEWGQESYWSSVTNPEDSSRAHKMTTGYFSIERDESKNWDHVVIAVRGGRPSD